MSIDTIAEEQFKNLSNDALVDRIDNFFQVLNSERYGMLPTRGEEFAQFKLKASEIYNTKRIQAKNQTSQRNILLKLFNFLLQMEFVEVSLGLTNHTLQMPDSLSRRVAYEAKDQWTIISSVTAWEAFLEFIYFIDKDAVLPRSSRRSKYVAIKKWLLEKNTFSYFVLVAYKAMMFDHGIRAQDIHGMSFRYKEVLTLSGNPFGRHSTLDLFSELLNIKQPLIDICNDQKPRSITIHGIDAFGWAKVYFNGSREDVDKKIEEIVNEMI